VSESQNPNLNAAARIKAGAVPAAARVQYWKMARRRIAANSSDCPNAKHGLKIFHTGRYVAAPL